jgi:hypothetical protein
VSNVLTVIGGDVGWCALAGETGALATANIYGGTVQIGCAITTANIYGGTVTMLNAATITTATIASGATLALQSTGTITTAHIAGTIDNSAGKVFTITNCNLFSGGNILDPYGKIVFTNGIILQKCKASATTIDVGISRTLGVT